MKERHKMNFFRVKEIVKYDFMSNKFECKEVFYEALSLVVEFKRTVGAYEIDWYVNSFDNNYLIYRDDNKSVLLKRSERLERLKNFFVTGTKRYKEYLSQYEEDIINMSYLCRNMVEYLDWSKRAIRKSDVRVSLPEDISNYKFRYMISNIPIWLYVLGKTELASEFIIDTIGEMDRSVICIRTFRDVLIEGVLNSKNLTDFLKLMEIRTQIIERLKHPQKMLNIVSDFFEEIYHIYEAKKDDITMPCFGKRFEYLNDTDPKIINNIYEVPSFLDMRKRYAYLVNNINDISLKDIDNTRRWLFHFIEDPGCCMPDELFYKGTIPIPKATDKKRFMIIDTLFGGVEAFAVERLFEIEGFDTDAEVHGRLFSLFRESMDKLVGDLTDLRRDIVNKDDISTADEEKIEELMKKMQELLKVVNNENWSAKAHREIADSMKEFCDKIGKDENLFDKIGDPAVKNEVYRAIYSGLVYFESLKHLNDDKCDSDKIDFAGCILQMTLSIELLLRYIYNGIKHKFPDYNNLERNTQNDYKAYYYFDRAKGEYELKDRVELGALACLLKKRDSLGTSLVIRHGQEMIDFGNLPIDTVISDDPELLDFDGTEETSDISMKIFRAVDKVRDPYRNNAAHGAEYISITDVDKCKKLLLQTVNVLWVLLEILK